MSISPRMFRGQSQVQNPRKYVDHPTVDPEREPFLHFTLNTKLSFQDEMTIFNSLVALVKTEYPFDKALQDRAVSFLKSLPPKWRNELRDRLATTLIDSSHGPFSDFIESVSTLILSHHSNVVKATLLFLMETTDYSYLGLRYRLVESDVVTKLVATVRPHTLPISGNEEIFKDLLRFISRYPLLTYPSNLKDLGFTTPTATYSLREMIFQKVVLPSSKFVTFLISNRYILNGELLFSFTYLLGQLLRICQFHRPTLEFVLASPIALALHSCLSYANNDVGVWNILVLINSSLESWKDEGPEVTRNVKRILQSLFSEGFEDTLEQMMKLDKSVSLGTCIVLFCHSITKMLGSNVMKPKPVSSEQE
ncbi:hypothetical protein BLNAU_9735 [Blattamonas nauphoetae]|uniref:Uncharacterized protein n=1 Tax=Blattamonas nauphoetae TaxID=2049346 RepID=A0ABQ9XV36_9EUKA|nr:hypothetical protein BLNAU_9735 [Blattamonas nauphoetae]